MRIEILEKKIFPNSFFNRCLDIVIFILDFSAAKDERSWLFRVCIRCGEIVRGWKDIDNDIYSNVSQNNNL